MFTSDTNSQRKFMEKTVFVYLIVSLVCALFGAVYEYFSHEVYSYYMLYAFAFPLAGGVLPFQVMILLECRLPRRLSLNLYHSGVSALTVGSIFQGVLDIYGTTNSLVSIYWVIGVIFVLCGVGCYLIGWDTKFEKSSDDSNN